MNHELKSIIKRISDIFITFFLSIFTIPLFLLVAVLIKLDSHGPVFFRHMRIGKDGKPFKMWKFRTMVQDASQLGSGLTKTNDMRITTIGRYLRRLSLDELPQIINVMKGEMSIVGPRPEIPEIVKTYTPEQKKALTVKPGMTGLSQINGRDDLPIDIKLNYEIEYVERYSFTLDWKIIFKTIPVLINGRGNRC
jgi:undecaprenyl phosphate N,N'-diacetylbacillosamine 1-phosphate transferase